MFKNGDKVGIVVLSNGIDKNRKQQIEDLIIEIKKLGLVPIIGEYIYSEESHCLLISQKKAKVLMDFYKNKDIKAVFDISGGDLANEILPFIDFEIIKNNYKPFFGYSDLTTVINAIYSNTKNPCYLYQIKNIILDNNEKQIRNFNESFFNGKDDIFKFDYEFLRGDRMKGVVIGGNIRCFLKLAGTGYIPDFKDKILFLESRSGKSPLMISFFNQLKQMNVFEDIRGIILGTFTQMERENSCPNIKEIALDITKEYSIPIIKTNEIGHGSDSKCIVIGKEYNLSK